MATEIPYTLGESFGVLRRRWIYLATLLPAAILIAVYLAFTLPPVYLSSATILLESSSIPGDMIKTTVTAIADQQIEIVRGRVMTAENLTQLVAEIDPYPDRPDLTTNDKVALVAANSQIEHVDPITLEPLLVSNAFSIHYRNPDADIAVKTARRLAQMFLDYNRETRTQQATETLEFLQAQSTEASDKIVELERRMAEFRAQYGDALPEAQARNEELLDRAERELSTLEQQILLAKDRQGTLQVQLSQVNPNLFDPAGDWRKELHNAEVGARGGSKEIHFRPPRGSTAAAPHRRAERRGRHESKHGQARQSRVQDAGGPARYRHAGDCGTPSERESSAR